MTARMNALGFTLTHSELVGDVELEAWSKTTPARRELPPSKRAETNIEGAPCTTQCGYFDTVKANVEDCRHVYTELYTKAAQFRVATGASCDAKLL